MTIDKWYVLTIDSPADISIDFLAATYFASFEFVGTHFYEWRKIRKQLKAETFLMPSKFVEKNFEL